MCQIASAGGLQGFFGIQVCDEVPEQEAASPRSDEPKLALAFDPRLLLTLLAGAAYFGGKLGTTSGVDVNARSNRYGPSKDVWPPGSKPPPGVLPLTTPQRQHSTVESEKESSLDQPVASDQKSEPPPAAEKPAGQNKEESSQPARRKAGGKQRKKADSGSPREVNNNPDPHDPQAVKNHFDPTKPLPATPSPELIRQWGEAMKPGLHHPSTPAQAISRYERMRDFFELDLCRVTAEEVEAARQEAIAALERRLELVGHVDRQAERILAGLRPGVNEGDRSHFDQLRGYMQAERDSIEASLGRLQPTGFEERIAEMLRRSWTAMVADETFPDDNSADPYADTEPATAERLPPPPLRPTDCGIVDKLKESDEPGQPDE